MDAAWGKFEEQIGRKLGQLGAGSFSIEVEAETEGEGSTPYVQFLGSKDLVRGEVASNRFLDRACRLGKTQKLALVALGWNRPDDEHPNWWIDVTRDELPLLSSMTVGALRVAIGVHHPEFLEWDDQPTVAQVQPVEIAYPESDGELSALVEATLARHIGHETVFKDDEGDIPMRNGKVLLWVQVLPGSRTVRIFSHLVVNANVRQARIEVDILNRRTGFLKFVLADRAIVASVDLPAAPFVAAHLRGVLDLAAEVLNEVVDDLALRTNGRSVVDRASTPRHTA